MTNTNRKTALWKPGQKITGDQREAIRTFHGKYPWIPQKDLADLFCVSRARISEVCRSDSAKGGK